MNHRGFVFGGTPKTQREGDGTWVWTFMEAPARLAQWLVDLQRLRGLAAVAIILAPSTSPILNINNFSSALMLGDLTPAALALFASFAGSFDPLTLDEAHDQCP
jgi:hypothetical protein